MFCGNCGFSVDPNVSICPNCGSSLNAEPAPASVPVPAPEPAPVFNPVSVAAVSQSKGLNKTLITVIASLLIGAAIATVIFLMLGSSGGVGKDENSAYAKEVKQYLDYLTEKNDDPEAFITDGYMGGNFGRIASGKDADKINILLVEKIFEDEMEYSNMYYESFDYDTWEDYVEGSAIDYLYEDMDDLGDWEMTYTITQTRQLSKERIENLNNENGLETIIESYEESEDDLGLGENDDFSDFLKKLKKADIKKAYGVEVEIKFDTDEEGEFSFITEFLVAEINGEWTILDGISYENMAYYAYY